MYEKIGWGELSCMKMKHCDANNRIKVSSYLLLVPHAHFHEWIWKLFVMLNNVFFLRCARLSVILNSIFFFCLPYERCSWHLEEFFVFCLFLLPHFIQYKNLCPHTEENFFFWLQNMLYRKRTRGKEDFTCLERII